MQINKLKKYTGIVLVGILLMSFSQGDSNEEKPNRRKQGIVQSMVFSALDARHYHAPKINDEYAATAFDEYIKSLDYGKQFLLSTDIEKLSVHKTRLDDYIQNAELDLYLESQEILKERIQEAKTYYQEILAKPFDYEIKEEIDSDAENRMWCDTKDDLKEVWRRNLKLSTLSRIYSREKTQEGIKEGEKKTSWKELEKASREATLKSIESWFDRMGKLKDEDRFEQYINSLLHVIDPHTTYLAPKSNEDFNISMSGKLEGIGARLSQAEGEIKVAEIIPGSPCHLQGELEVEDIILKAAEKEKEPTDLEDMLLSDAIRYIRGDKGTPVTLTVRKIDGSLQDITIVRDVIVNKETYAKSALIGDEKEVGYIKLPKFYVDFSDRKGRRCSTDMKKELQKLQAEGVDKVIIDLRNNTGGSLSDVVDIAGYFISDGPIVQVKSYDGNKKVWNDRDKKMVFDGKLIVLINNFSASASEILAGALKDYDRAIIMGSNQSFGKGTVQNVMSFDRQFGNRFKNLGQLGSLKITTHKFYRINGESTQRRGVKSDIVLPDNYRYINIGENDREFALAWDKMEMAKHDFYRNKLNEKKAKKYYDEFLAKDSVFQFIDQQAKELKADRDDSMVPLHYKTYKQERKQEEEDSKGLDELMENNRKDLVINNLSVDLPEIQKDSLYININKKWIESLENDIYLQEAVKVMEF
ncbi:MAG: carboxy terminal-processing peptidase [Flavobacteriales bacterium]|jgi:carboxyl-terminal processing protease|nr:carboxy terminal-processing peptidase [Flavobacteriales bacterium]